MVGCGARWTSWSVTRPMWRPRPPRSGRGISPLPGRAGPRDWPSLSKRILLYLQSGLFKGRAVPRDWLSPSKRILLYWQSGLFICGTLCLYKLFFTSYYCRFKLKIILTGTGSHCEREFFFICTADCSCVVLSAWKNYLLRDINVGAS